jgi:hypothetical protein
MNARVRTTTASDGTHLSDTDRYGLSEYAAPVPGEPGTIVVSHNGRWLQLVTPTGVVDTADDLESPRAVAMVSGGPGRPRPSSQPRWGWTVVPLLRQVVRCDSAQPRHCKAGKIRR